MNNWIKNQKWHKKTADITDPFKVKLPDKKLKKEELISAVRQSIIAEQDAIVLYESYANSSTNKKFKEVFLHVADEEKHHLGEFQALLEHLVGPEERKLFEEGIEEAKEEMKEARSRYPGQLQGDEHRTQDSALDERYLDNEVVEGEHVRRLRNYAKTHSWVEFTRYTQKLQEEGFSKNRIDSMVSRATMGLRF